MWIIIVKDIHGPAKVSVTDYGVKISQGQSYLSGHFLERLHFNKSSTIYKIAARTTFFYKESNVLLYVDVVEKNNTKVEITNPTKTETLLNLKQNGYSHF